jgi:hypothetical protein
MNCDDSKNLMTVSVYGKLTTAEKSWLEAHLQECRGCSGRYERVKKLNNLFTEKKDVPPPDMEKSWRIISADLFKRRRGRTAPFAMKRPVFGFSLALFLLIIGFVAGYLVRSGGQRDAEIAQLRREVLDIREITAASFLRQESLSAGIKGMQTESLAAPAEDTTFDSFLQAIIVDPVKRRQFIDSFSEQTSPVVEIALVLARHIERL